MFFQRGVYSQARSKFFNSTFHTTKTFSKTSPLQSTRTFAATANRFSEPKMSSLYDQSIPVMIKFFENASIILDKAAAWADENGMKHEEMLAFRLRDDMRPLPYQIQSMSNTAKFFCTRVLGMPNIVLEDNETTFAELKARIVRSIEILNSIDQSKLDIKKIAEDPVIMERPNMKFRFESGQKYLSEYAIPNFHFHLTTAYCIVRNIGVPVSAFDYLNGVFHKVE